ncbi:hypothetical protein N9J93_00395 [Methylophilaceae bacterium]|nr:hypothetical protein [Methylophilaceae bacterium]
MNENEFFFYYVIGLGLVGSIIYFTESFPIHNPKTYLIFILVILFLNLKNIKEIFAENIYLIKNNMMFNPFIAILFFIYFMLINMPEIGYDALAHHNFIASTMKWKSYWDSNVEMYVFAVMPHMIDQFYTFIYMLSDSENLIKYFNFFSIVGSIYILKLIFKLSSINLNHYYLIVLFILSFPITYLLASTAFIDLTLTLFLLSAFYFLLKFNKDRKIIFLLYMSTFLGFSLASKAISIIYVFIFFLISIYFLKNENIKDIIKKIIFCSIPIFFLGAYPYVNAFFLTENPLFPLYNDVFQSSYYHHTKFNNGYSSGVSYDFIDKITFKSNKYIEGYRGSAGFTLGMAFLPLLVLSFYKKNYAAIKFYILGAVLVILLCYGTAYLRYLYTAFLFCFIAMIASIDNKFLSKKEINVWIIILITSIVLNIIFLNKATHANGILSKKIITSNIAKERFLKNINPHRLAIRKVNELNIKNENTMFLTYPLTFELRSEAVLVEWYNYKFQDEILALKTSDEFIEITQNYSIRYIIIDDTYGEVRYKLDKNTNKKILNIIKSKSTLIEKINNLEIRRVNN